METVLDILHVVFQTMSYCSIVFTLYLICIPSAYLQNVNYVVNESYNTIQLVTSNLDGKSCGLALSTM